MGNRCVGQKYCKNLRSFQSLTETSRDVSKCGMNLDCNAYRNLSQDILAIPL